MIRVRPAQARGRTDFGWLDSKHTFSFGSYYDPSQMGFSNLRVINEDKVRPGKGFGPHSHQDMEIISYVLEGELEHKDNIGNGSVIRSGDIQRLSAGSGIAHSEFNSSDQELVHFLQIWITPNIRGIKPSYEQKNFSLIKKQGQLKLVASPDGKDGTVKINQDASLYIAVLNKGEKVSYSPDVNRSIWVQVAKGNLEINGKLLYTGDGAAISEETALEFIAQADRTEILLFDLV